MHYQRLRSRRILSTCRFHTAYRLGLLWQGALLSFKVCGKRDLDKIGDRPLFNSRLDLRLVVHLGIEVEVVPLPLDICSP